MNITRTPLQSHARRPAAPVVTRTAEGERVDGFFDLSSEERQRARDAVARFQASRGITPTQHTEQAA